MSKRTLLVGLTACVVLAVTISAVLWVQNTATDGITNHQVGESTTPTASDMSSDDESEGYLPSMPSKNGELVKVTVDPYGKLLPQDEKPLTKDDPHWLTAQPKGLEWQTSEYYMPMIVGMSTSDGPTKFIENIPSGFSHTPQGAVLAAFTINSAQIGGETCRYAAQNFFYPPKTEAEAEERCSDFDTLVEEGDAIPNAPPSAVEIRSYDGTAVSMYLWFYHPEEPSWRQYVRREEYVVWVDGQWKLDKRISFTRTKLYAGEIHSTASRWL